MEFEFFHQDQGKGFNFGMDQTTTSPYSPRSSQNCATAWT